MVPRSIYLFTCSKYDAGEEKVISQEEIDCLSRVGSFAFKDMAGEGTELYSQSKRSLNMVATLSNAV